MDGADHVYCLWMIVNYLEVGGQKVQGMKPGTKIKNELFNGLALNDDRPRPPVLFHAAAITITVQDKWRQNLFLETTKVNTIASVK